MVKEIVGDPFLYPHEHPQWIECLETTVGNIATPTGPISVHGCHRALVEAQDATPSLLALSLSHPLVVVAGCLFLAWLVAELYERNAQ